jgi:hypothetical protein
MQTFRKLPNASPKQNIADENNGSTGLFETAENPQNRLIIRRFSRSLAGTKVIVRKAIGDQPVALQ